MTCYTRLDLAQNATAICVVDEEARISAEKNVLTCSDAIADFLTNKALRACLENYVCWISLRDRL